MLFGPTINPTMQEVTRLVLPCAQLICSSLATSDVSKGSTMSVK